MTWTVDGEALRDRVAVVAGATRGAGRGIAAALGEAGATVDLHRPQQPHRRAALGLRPAPRRSRRRPSSSPPLGGTGIAMVVDHLDPAQVQRAGRAHPATSTATSTCWSTTSGAARCSRAARPSGTRRSGSTTSTTGLRILRLAIDTHLITSHHLLPLLVDRPGGLLVEVTDGTTEYNATHYRISVFYDLAKVAVNRLAFSQGHELAPHGGTAVAVTPGWLRSEMMLEAFGVTEANWRDALGAGRWHTQAPPGFAASESPRYVGRAVAALAADPDRARWNQRSVTAGQLAREYGFTDLDGSQPDVWSQM